MEKKACRKDDFKEKKDSKFECTKCGLKVKKKSQACKPEKYDNKKGSHLL